VSVGGGGIVGDKQSPHKEIISRISTNLLNNFEMNFQWNRNNEPSEQNAKDDKNLDLIFEEEEFETEQK